MQTEKQGHAREYAETFDLTQITGIVLASGDGLIYEVRRLFHALFLTLPL